MGVQQIDADQKKAMADEEAVKANAASEAAGVVEAEAEVELAKAVRHGRRGRGRRPPEQGHARRAEGLWSPPGVDKVTACCLILWSTSTGTTSGPAKKMMGNVDKFLQTLKEYEGETIPRTRWRRCPSSWRATSISRTRT